MIKEVLSNMNKVYHWLEDAQSKEIFHLFFKCRWTGDYRPMIPYASTYVQKEWELQQKLKKSARVFDVHYDQEGQTMTVSHLPVISPEQEIIIYGGGRMGQILASHYKNHPKILIADCYYETVGTIEGISVISEDEAIRTYPKALYFIASGTYAEKFCNYLLEAGISYEQMIHNSYITDLKNQYFDFFQGGEDEIFVDGGSYDGSTSLLFAQWAKSYEKIYIFEPDEQNCENMNQNLKEQGLHDFEVFPVGMWDKEETLYVQENGSSSTLCTESTKGVKVPVNSLDNCLQGREITFLKMDIEGAELAALHGAKETIQKYKPKLSICVYHKVEDILDIPLYLKELVPEYQFAFRHYTSQFSETVLYAWIN